MKFRAMDRARRRMEKRIAIQSPFLKGLEEYQVRFLFLPKPLSSMAAATISILSMEETIRGKRSVAAHLSLLKRLSFFLSS